MRGESSDLFERAGSNLGRDDDLRLSDSFHQSEKPLIAKKPIN
jgi:hypothetical protein